MPATELSGRPRRRVAAQVRREEPNCWICHLPIDLSLCRSGPTPHPMSSTLDEVIPRSLHPLGPLYAALDRSNVRHAHRICNLKRGVGTKRPPESPRSRVW